MPLSSLYEYKGVVALSEISLHLLKHGMHELYTSWRYHGESSVQAAQLTHKDNTTTECAADNDDVTTGLNENITTDVDENVREGMDENVEAGVDENVTAGVDENVTAELDENVGTSLCGQKKRSAAEKAREPLYPSCPNGKSVMYAAIMMNNINTQYRISDNGVTATLELMKELLPEGNNMPCKYPDIKKIIKELGMDYVTYDACVNDCILYWKDNSSLVKCRLCQEPRYVRVFNDEKKLTQVAQKTLMHSPIIVRLKRLYSIPWIAEAMLWHSRVQRDVNVMCHPVDSTAWRCADNFCPEFAKEARNVTPGIATDGFNPNGPRAPGKDIDVYLQLLIEELKELWNDVGCVTHGYYACPTCGEETVSEWLPYSKKICYMGHRRWMPSQHKYRFDKTNFIGGVEDGKAPWPLTGFQVQEMVKDMKSKQGKGKPPAKKRKRGEEVDSLQQGPMKMFLTTRYFLEGPYFMICLIWDITQSVIVQMLCIQKRT
ncbi:uncharacterized protein LOC113311195 [Papaver somniferum]|uniref:uncharacterized protein LOC113311195 n=1 Tax=Papaver somniferum TaxID=3469 RepID=UPI000E6F470F|nr:uncharacterized protein LOC113311195 [Papaver somniferum]